MTEDPLHLGEVNAGLEQVRSAAVPELMHGDQGHASALCESVNGVANSLRSMTLAASAHQQSLLTEPPRSLQHVVSGGRVGLQAAVDQIGHRYAALASSFATIDPQGRLGTIKGREIEPLEFAAA